MKRKEITGMKYLFRQKWYVIVDEKDVPKVVRDIGIVRQFVVRPEKAPTGGKWNDLLIQEFTDGCRRAIRQDGKVNYDYQTRNVWN